MVPVEEQDVFRDHNGTMVLNGAAGVKKLKKIGGEMRSMQRFISNFIPINSYQKHLEGGDKHLPYLGQLTLLNQDEDDVWVVDSEDFVSCFRTCGSCRRGGLGTPVLGRQWMPNFLAEYPASRFTLPWQ